MACVPEIMLPPANKPAVFKNLLLSIDLQIGISGQKYIMQGETAVNDIMDRITRFTVLVSISGNRCTCRNKNSRCKCAAGVCMLAYVCCQLILTAFTMPFMPRSDEHICFTSAVSWRFIVISLSKIPASVVTVSFLMSRFNCL